jgi:hypothetical protein
MSTSIDQAFIEQFENEVFVAYQRQGSKFRGTVRTIDGVVGDRMTFFKVGKGTATTKARHGVIPPMNLGHTNVECTLGDYYAADWVDKLDMLKTNIDEMRLVAASGAYALGRKTDELIIAALEATSSTISPGTGYDKTAVLNTFSFFNENDVPDDGNRYVCVSPKGWNQLMLIAEFISADYIGQDQLPWKTGTQAKRWMNIIWYMHTGLTLATTRKCLAYHTWAAGHAIGADVDTDVTWHGDRAAHFVNSMMSMGAKLIDATGVAVCAITE